MDQQTLKKLITQLIDDKVKLICDCCRKKETQKKLGYYSYSLSINPKNTTLIFDLTQDFSNKENKAPILRLENRVKSSKSQVQDFFKDHMLNDISEIQLLNQLKSPREKKSTQLLLSPREVTGRKQSIQSKKDLQQNSKNNKK